MKSIKKKNEKTWYSMSFYKLFTPKLAFLFFLVLCFTLCPVNANAQSELVSINRKNATLKTILNDIESQTRYLFIYGSDVNSSVRVSVNVKRKPVSDVLKEVLTPQNITYTLKENHIILENAKTSRKSTTDNGNLRKISGTVTDQTGSPLIGVAISVEGTNRMAVTDVDGNFSIQAKDGETLTASYIGFTPQRIQIGSSANYGIKMQEEAKNLDEVVVVGYGVQKKVDLTGSVSTVNMSDILGDRAVTTTGSLLEGILPGLQVTSSSGEPGVGFSYNIRGTTSINGGSPLILVDNVPFSGPLNLISPNDIESVTVLKDASSASIYGARSAFGVILITTKSAGREKKATLQYNNNFSFTSPSELPTKASPLETVQAYSDMGYVTYYSGQTVDTWLNLLNEYNENHSNYPDGFTIVDGVRYQLAETDVLKDFLSETGFQQNHNLSINGGAKKSAYRISLGYTGSDGIMTSNMDTYKRYNAKGLINAEITSWLDATLDISYYKSDKSMPSGANYSTAVWAPSYTPLGMIDVNGEELYSGTPGNLTRLGGKNKTGITDTRIFSKLTSKPMKGLELNFEFTYDNLNQKIENYSKRVRFANAAKFTEEYTLNGSTYYQNRSITNYTAINAYGSYSFNLKKNNFKILLGYNQESSHYDYLQANTSYMINDEMPSISQSTGVQKAYDGISEYTVQGFFGRLNYNYDERYLLEINGRYDASSKFPKNNRWGFFPSASVGWRISEEKFMESVKDVVNNMKLRFSVGSIGNQNISPYQFVPGMSSYKSTWLDNNTQPITLNMPDLVSGNFTWETVVTVNGGLDLGFFGNRLNATFDIYNRTTKDMLTNGSQLPAVLGTTAPLQNVANLRSYGYELSVSWQDRIGQLAYHIGFNLYDYKAKITKFKNNISRIIRTSSNNTYVEGQRIGEIWGYTTDRYYTVDDFVEGSLDSNLKNGVLKDGIPHVEGVNPNPGDILYKDFDGNGIINSGNETVDNPGDRRIIGNNSLRLQYGINGGLSWKNFDFSFFIDGVGKCDRWVANDLIFPYYYEFGTIYSHELDYWTPENVNAKYPRVYEAGYRNSNYAANIMCQTKYLSNAAYLRIRNITLSYSLPRTLISKWFCQNLRFYLSIENLATFDHMPDGIDPTVTATSSGLGYPVMRSFSFGFNITI